MGRGAHGRFAFYGNRERLHPSLIATRRVPARDWQKGVTWDTVKLIQDEIGNMPLFIKGVMTAEDAALCVEHRVQGVYISNHGGRQLDHTLGNIEMLPEIVKRSTARRKSSSMAGSIAARTCSRRLRSARMPSASDACRPGAGGRGLRGTGGLPEMLETEILTRWVSWASTG